MAEKAFIELTNIETFHEITHYKICNWTFEVPRPSLGKEGYLDLWLAKCYPDSGNYIEPPVPGVNIKIEGADFEDLISRSTTVKDLITDSMQIISDFLVEKGYVDGVVILAEAD
jgi:hypothetical protein